MTEIKHATDDTFEPLVTNNDRPVVVDFLKPGEQPAGVTGFRPLEELERTFDLAALVTAES